MTPDEERIERLERALLEMVYYDNNPLPFMGWYTEYPIDTDVTNIIGDLLDKHKPKDPSL
jgi:hypothetical protein